MLPDRVVRPNGDESAEAVLASDHYSHSGILNRKLRGGGANRLKYTVLHYTILYYTILYYTILYYNMI